MNKLKIYLILIAASLMVFMACNNTNEPKIPTFNNVDELVKWCGRLPEAPPTQAQKKKLASQELMELNTNNGNYYTTQATEYELTRGFDEIININDMNKETLYPGSIVKGKDLAKGLLSPISYIHPRRPITLIMNLF